MKPILIRGSRQRENARHVISELNNTEKAHWFIPETETTLVIAPELADTLGYWVSTGKVAAGTVLTLLRWRNDCDCSPDAPMGATNHCHGHTEEVTVSSACHGQPWTLFIEGWKSDKGVDCIQVNISGVHIGSRCQP